MMVYLKIIIEYMMIENDNYEYKQKRIRMEESETKEKLPLEGAINEKSSICNIKGSQDNIAFNKSQEYDQTYGDIIRKAEIKQIEESILSIEPMKDIESRSEQVPKNILGLKRTHEEFASSTFPKTFDDYIQKIEDNNYEKSI